MRNVYALLLVSVLATPVHAEVPGTDRPFVTLDAGLSIFGEAAHREYVARAFALSARGGWRWGNWGAFLQLAPAFWFAAEGSEDDELSGALNLGGGGEYLYADGFVRTSLATGPSVLITGTDLDESGQVGFFFELRPAGLRWQVADRWVIGLDPLVLSVIAPVLEGIPLVELEYRTTVTGEYLF